MTAAATQYDFRTKYTKQNLATRILLDGFFRGVEGLVQQAGLAAGEALEVGCGEGFSTEHIKRMLPSGMVLSAVEIEERLIAEARVRNPDVSVQQGSIYALAREPRSVDVVISLEVLEHLEHPADGLRELARVSRRWLLLSVPREPMWRAMNVARGKYLFDLGNTPGHVNHWSRRRFVRFVEGVAHVRAVRTPLPWTMLLAEVR